MLFFFASALNRIFKRLIATMVLLFPLILLLVSSIYLVSSQSAPRVSSRRDPCTDPRLQWKRAKRTWYESYPTSELECNAFNGCAWQGAFAICPRRLSPAQVRVRDIAAVYPPRGIMGRQICVRRPNGKTMIVNAIDTCSDSDCKPPNPSNCCSRNARGVDALIDLEISTSRRLGGINENQLSFAVLPISQKAC